MAFIKVLFFYHVFLSIIYYIYAVYNPSDSTYYYYKVTSHFRGDGWSDFYGTSTTFVEWFGYPFIHYLNFSYEAMMALFSFMGFVGFIYFYKLYKERIRFDHKLFSFSLITLFFFLPNLHFWAGSFGKGSIILMGIACYFYGLNSLKKRFMILLIGAVLTYHIRPHIMLVMLVSSVIGFTFSSKGISLGLKILAILAAVGAFAFIYQDVISLVGIDQGEELNQGLDLTHRATELSKATSGVDITSYSLPFQVFTFLFRPLFFDAPGMLGLIVSFENIFLLFVTIWFLSKGGFLYIIKGDFLIKTAFFSFITVSIALAQISGNLGIAIRQKSQVMLLFLFVIISMFDDQKMKIYKQQWLAWKRKQMMQKQQANLAE